jgi:Carboxypeptidase regulatory-like domain
MKANYPCAQEHLYPTCRVAIKKLATIKPRLVAHKPKYADPFFDNLLKNVNAADLLPDHAARKSSVDSLKVDIADDSKDVLKYSILLESYIRDAFPAAKYKIMCEAAGSNYWKKAQGGNLASLSALSTSMVQFVVDYTDILSADNNMPKTFLTDIKAIDTTFKSTNSQLTDAKTTLPDARDEKLEANNNIHSAVISALLDAQDLEPDNPAWAKTYTFTAMLSQVRGIPNAGFSGRITQKDSKKSIKDVQIIVENDDRIVLTEEDGRYEYTPLSMGKYKVTIIAAGYVTQMFENVVIKTGVMTRLNVKMIAVAG